MLLNEVNFRIRPPSNDFDDIEIIEVDFGIVQLGQLFKVIIDLVVVILVLLD